MDLPSEFPQQSGLNGGFCVTQAYRLHCRPTRTRGN